MIKIQSQDKTNIYKYTKKDILLILPSIYETDQKERAIIGYRLYLIPKIGKAVSLGIFDNYILAYCETLKIKFCKNKTYQISPPI